jgi:hypothetical protein
MDSGLTFIGQESHEEVCHRRPVHVDDVTAGLEVSVPAAGEDGRRVDLTMRVRVREAAAADEY